MSELRRYDSGDRPSNGGVLLGAVIVLLTCGAFWAGVTWLWVELIKGWTR